jgi:predicted helicase
VQTFSEIQKSNPLLKLIFEYAHQDGATDKIELRKLHRYLKKSNIVKIVENFNRQNPGKDPIIHLYEFFLKEYNLNQKVNRGVFYTPDSVASFIVRAVDYLLRTELNCPDGLANSQSPEIQILDPSTGTGTFLMHVIEIIKKRFEVKLQGLEEKQAKQTWNEYVSNHLLQNVFGIELMLVPYVAANINLLLKLMETGYDFDSKRQLGIYLHNALEGLDKVHKHETDLSIIIGNPPYMVNSSNNPPLIRHLLKDYKKAVKEEKYIKPLSDDYIKFIRLSQHLIDTTGLGIVAMVTNHGYLSGLIHRGMRQNLLRSFDKIYILDLHGNTNIGETSPDGSDDQNVFDIQQGVAISIFIKISTKKAQPDIYHFDLWGDRESKYEFLDSNDLSTINWTQLHPSHPNYFFIPYDPSLAEEYNSYLSLKDMFKLQRIGILTNRDWLTIDFSPEELKTKIIRFFSLLDTPEIVSAFPQLADTWWDYSKIGNLNAQEAIKNISRCLFRPFDIRYIIYHPLFLNRARKEVMDHINGKENLVLITSRHYRKETFNSCFISELIVEQKAGESTRGSYVFPLYSYSNGKKELNFTPLVKQVFKSSLSEFNEYAIIDYIYAILHSNSYRERYQEYLKLDFPRIPIIQNPKYFAQLTNLGQKLRQLHLLKNEPMANITFLGSGNNTIEKGYPKFKENAVYINGSQYFQGISLGVWTFTIGGYRMCQKWLKDRKNRVLNNQDILIYQKIISAIFQTLEIMNEIEDIIENYGAWPKHFNGF